MLHSPSQFQHKLRDAACLVALAWLSPHTAQAQTDWRVCAMERQICAPGGEAMVRFGADGKYAFRVLREPQACTMETFGFDPAPGQRKQCEISSAWRENPSYRHWQRQTDGVPKFPPTPSVQTGRNTAYNTPYANGWQHCAPEGGTCVVNGPASVRFGVGQQYVTRQITRQAPIPVDCHTDMWGDPAPGRVKSCEVMGSPPNPWDAPSPYSHTADSGWALCAYEGELCRVTGPTRIRFGTGNRYVEGTAVQSFACTSALLGDPAPGTAKLCEVSTAPR